MIGIYGGEQMEDTKRTHKLTEEELERFWKFAAGDELDFYEGILMNQPEEQQQNFLEQHPDFFAEYKLNPWKDENRIMLLQDKIFRGLMRRIGK